MKVYINGKLFPQREAKVSVFDHGLLYGDGVFEGIRSHNGRIFKLDEHIDRLYESAHSIMLKIPLSKKQMVSELIRTLKANKLKDAYIRIEVTRGEGDLGLDPRKCLRPTVIIITHKIALYPEDFYLKGIELVTVATQRSIPKILDPQIKSLNYLNNILAKIEAINAGKQEAIMLSPEGYVVECTGENIFMVKKGELITPPASLGALRGITRQTIMDIAGELGIPASEQIITRHNLFNADEVFLAGTAAQILSVSQIDGRVIGKNRQNLITRKLRDAFDSLTGREGVEIK